MIESGEMDSRKQGRFQPPGEWERDVPYDIRERTFQFAVRVLRAVRQLSNDQASRVAVYHTSVDANVE